MKKDTPVSKRRGSFIVYCCQQASAYYKGHLMTLHKERIFPHSLANYNIVRNCLHTIQYRIGFKY